MRLRRLANIGMAALAGVLGAAAGAVIATVVSAINMALIPSGPVFATIGPDGELAPADGVFASIMNWPPESVEVRWNFLAAIVALVGGAGYGFWFAYQKVREQQAAPVTE